MYNSINCLFLQWGRQLRARNVMYALIHSMSVRGASYPLDKNPAYLRYT